jgi:two-component system, cell cycle sensor histidine kinase and response regulator CckA
VVGLFFPLYAGSIGRRLALASLFSAASVGAIAAARLAAIRTASAILTGGIWIVLTYIAVTGRGVHGEAYAAYVVVVVVSSLLGGSAAGFAAVALSALAGLAMALAERSGVLVPRPSTPTALQAWGLNAAMFVSCWLTARLATASVRDSLMRAHAELGERRIAEAAAKESDERFRRLAEATSEGVAISDEGRVVDANRALITMLGCAAEAEIIGRPVADFVAPQSRSVVGEHLRDHSEEFYEHTARRRDGSDFPVEVRSRHVPFMGRTVRVSVIRDITERRRTDDLLMTIARGVALTTGETFFRSLVAQLASGLSMNVAFIGALSEDGRRIKVLAATGSGRLGEGSEYAVDGVPCGTVLGHPVVVYPEAVAARFPSDAGLRADGIEAYAGASLPGSDGRTLGVLVVMHRQRFQGVSRIESVLKIFAVRAAAEVELSRTLEERRRLEERLRQSQKLETIGQLAGGVAHDFNNLLSPILGYSEMLLEDVHPDDPRFRQIQFIREAAEKAASLTRQLLSFGRKQMLEIKPVDLNRVVTDFERILRRTIRENIAMTVRADAAASVIDGDVSQLEQILMNLAVNAQDAMPMGGRIEIATADTVVEQGSAPGAPDLAPGRYAVLTVTDSGTGMDKATLDRVFEPFFTTKDKGRGTGLGLATVYGIVTQHRGTIDVESAPGRGTTFRLFFPAIVGATPAEAVTPPGPLAAAPAAGTIVVVEDDAMVRELTSTILRQRGYRVLEMTDAEACLRHAESGGSPGDLLVTDVVMPGMDGKQLYDRLSRAYPPLKVLFISGYAHDVLAPHGLGGFHFIQKPFTPDGLVTKVREALGR